jgi:hypothetical protein
MKKLINIKNFNLNRQPKNPKNPIAYFFTYLYRWTFFYTYKLYSIFFPDRRPKIIDPVTKYVEANKNKLLDSFKILDMNKNIEKVFYNKKELQEILVNQNNELEKIWKTRILFENTPRGNIIMHYDVYKQGFAYYCDANGIPYNILNSVSMKYVTVYQCRDLFMDNEYFENEKESPLIKLYLEQEKEDKKDGQEKPLPKLDTIAFAKLKNYNKIEKTDDKKDEKNDDKTESKPEKEYNRNIFVNLGRICNFNFLNKPVKKSKLNGFYSSLLDGVASEGEVQNQVMNYSKYKELLKKKAN